MHYSREISSCSTFREITAFFGVSEILGFLRYIIFEHGCDLLIRRWDLIVSVPGHCLSFYFSLLYSFIQSNYLVHIYWSYNYVHVFVREHPRMGWALGTRVGKHVRPEN